MRVSLTAKWPELLKQIAPGVTRAGVLRDAAATGGVGKFAVIQSVAPSVGMEVSQLPQFSSISEFFNKICQQPT
jgi:putative ABC transport system substrate-binding protein